MKRIGFIGLGVMGGPMAANLIRAGFQVVVCNRSQAAVDQLVQLGATAAANPKEVAEQSDVVITMLPDTPDVERVYFGSDGILQAVRPGMVLLDMTTASPEIARRIYAAAKEKGAQAIDAPVSGGDVGAREGTLSIMMGGSESAIEEVRPILDVLGKNIVHIGDSGAGQITKACNQIVVALTIEAVGEALTLAAKAGVDPAKVRSALLGGFAQSRILDLHGQRSLEDRYQPGFRIKLHRKDLSIALGAANAMDVSLPVTAVVHEMMNGLIAQGHGEMDHSYLIKHLAEQSQTSIGAND